MWFSLLSWLRGSPFCLGCVVLSLFLLSRSAVFHGVERLLQSAFAQSVVRVHACTALSSLLIVLCRSKKYPGVFLHLLGTRRERLGLVVVLHHNTFTLHSVFHNVMILADDAFQLTVSQENVRHGMFWLGLARLGSAWLALLEQSILSVPMWYVEVVCLTINEILPAFLRHHRVETS